VRSPARAVLPDSQHLRTARRLRSLPAGVGEGDRHRLRL